MSVQARFKDCEECPCPYAGPRSVGKWPRLRGQQVTLIAPGNPPQHARKCQDSDFYWRITGNDEVAQAIGFSPSGEHMVCRHMLEIGD